MPGQVADLVAAGHVPQTEQAVDAAGGEELAVGAEADRPHLVGVALQDADGRRRLAGPPAGEVPEAHGPVAAARGEGAAVGADRTGRHRAGAATDRKPFLARLGVVGPDPRFRGLVVRDKHRPAVWAEVEKDVVAGGGQLAGLLRLSRLHIPARK